MLRRRFTARLPVCIERKSSIRKTMREYDDLCIEEAPAFNPKDIVHIRKGVIVSQSVFAMYLNTTVSTVRQWEQGDKKPSGIAARMLQLVQKNGLEIFD